jgi:LacI family transcriptional regulator
VSFILNNRPNTGISDETRQAVLQAAAELGYQPNRLAQSLASGKTGTLGVLVLEARVDAAGDFFLPELLRGVARVADATGFRLMLEYLGERSTVHSVPANFLAGLVDGVIVCGPDARDDRLAELTRSRVPVVVVGSPGEGDAVSIDIDNDEGGHQATSHLLDHGYRRIGMVTNLSFAATSSQDRLAGYRRALTERDVPYDERLVAEGGHDPSHVRVGVERLLALSPGPEAIFAASDQVAMIVLGALQAAGRRVPDDVALLGFDDLPVAALLHPTLSTVSVPFRELAEGACHRLLAQIQGNELRQRRQIVPTQLVLRQSCGHSNGKGGGAKRKFAS